MSGESNSSIGGDIVPESISDGVPVDDVESMLTDESATRSIGRKLGSRVGREIGAILGREIGAVVAVDVRERKGPRTILSDGQTRVVELLKSLFRNVDLTTAVSKLNEVGTDVVSGNVSETNRESVGIGAEDDDSTQASAEADSSAGEPGHDDAAGDDAGGKSTESDATSVSNLSADDLQDLKADTYRELLEAMSYRHLQSIAKETGVKANLEQTEMIDRIVEQFSADAADAADAEDEET